MSRFHKLDAKIDAALASDPAPQKPSGQEPDAPETPETPVPPEGEPDPQPEKEENMADDTPVEKTEAYAVGFKAANDRINTVFASEHFAGREASAVKLIGKANLSAEDVTELLADMPKREEASPEANHAAAEEAGRQAMQAAMASAGNKDLGSADVNADAGSSAAKADAIWDAAAAANNALRAKGA